MITRTFAAWVAPVAAELAEGRSQVVAFARTQAPEFWSRPALNEGWTCRDVLAHLAGDTGKGSLETMSAAAERRAPNPTPFAAGVDALNVRDVQERAHWSIEAIVAEIESDGELWQELLARLTDADEVLRWDGFPFAVGQYLRILATHDKEHLAGLRAALGDSTS